MATTLKPVDAVVVGFGWTGAILAKELTEAGLNVVALERGENRDTYPDGAYPNTLDELTYNIRGKLFQDLSKSTVTIRHGINDTALPYRQLAAFLPGDGVGGAGLHWSGVHFRIMPEELRLRSHYEERYGKKFIPEGMTIQDYGVSYDELEPHFDFAEKVFGTSGTAHTVKGQVVGKGNPFAADRSDDFPLPALRQVYSAQLFRKAAEELGLHPYDLPSANTSGPYTNPYGVQMGPCNFCGFCSGYACYMYSKASPNLNILPALRQTPLFELRTNCNVLKVNLDSDGKQRHRRDLRRRPGARDRAAGRAGDHRRVPVPQRAPAAALRHRQALRPAHRRGRGGQELRLPEHGHHQGVLRQGRAYQPLRRRRRQRRGGGRLQRRQLRPRPAGLRRRLADVGQPGRLQADRRPRRAARHAELGQRLETGGQGRLHAHRVDGRPRHATCPTATTTSTSIRPTRTPTASRCCA